MPKGGKLFVKYFIIILVFSLLLQFAISSILTTNSKTTLHMLGASCFDNTTFCIREWQRHRRPNNDFPFTWSRPSGLLMVGEGRSLPHQAWLTAEECARRRGPSPCNENIHLITKHNDDIITKFRLLNISHYLWNIVISDFVERIHLKFFLWIRRSILLM